MTMDVLKKINSDKKDLLWLAVLLAGLGLYLATAFNFSMHPAEDAAINMRYTRHAANGQGIVWNIGEKPVDGATEMAIMLLAAAVHKTGASIEASTRGIIFLSHFLTLILIYWGIRRLHGAPRWAAFVSAGYFAFGPGLGYAQVYFGTPFFALTVCAAWILVLLLADDPHSHAKAAGFAAASLLMGWVRPEGVFLAFFMLAALALLTGYDRLRTVLLYFAGIFGLLGGIYFIWRWDYFGSPLPNPFYVKGGSTLNFHSLKNALRDLVELSGPFLIPFVLCLRGPKTGRRALIVLIPVLGFSALWLLISESMNYLMRYQYPLLPLVLLSWPALVPFEKAGIRKKRGAAFPGWPVLLRVTASGMLLLALLYWQVGHHRGAGGERDGRYDVARILNDFSDRGYRLVTTEAGLLPFYSEWKSMDAWGLNDPVIAHRGRITEEDLVRFHPHVILFHAYFSPVAGAPGSDRWSQMVKTLQTYAESHGYRLAAAFGPDPHNTHYYYVRKDFADSAEIVRRIAGTEYFWEGRPTVNYAELKRT